MPRDHKEMRTERQAGVDPREAQENVGMKAKSLVLIANDN